MVRLCDGATGYDGALGTYAVLRCVHIVACVLYMRAWVHGIVCTAYMQGGAGTRPRIDVVRLCTVLHVHSIVQYVLYRR